ncbi:hypothetical protein PS900_03026 [Pseudomonas fluorescens]|uniref:Uncharacterized protein n=1 Tax=Pseudomonas fluorescens TaxID=294 RepID=A0A8H2RJQ0_PSEFL|nr:hypothetical protein [Pseudomonas fluorescens]VVP04708.1 hypothetical protein PS900_03026 [Pseudomonas fluorescens]
MTAEFDRGEELALKALEKSDTIDHFLLGVTAAICAYLAQTNAYAPLGLNRETFLLLSLLIFAFSAVFGLMRLQSTVAILHTNSKLSHAAEEKHPSIYEKANTQLGKAITYNHIRNGLLVAGLCCYVLTKVVASYQNNGWIPVH